MAIKEGKGHSLEGTVEAELESQLNGRANQELGEDPLIGVVNPNTGIMEVKEKWQYEAEQVIRDAKKLTELKPESVYTKNYFENQILMLYSNPEFDRAKVEKTIQDYTDLRLKECLLNKEFEEKVRNSQNGHIYLKVLKE